MRKTISGTSTRPPRPFGGLLRAWTKLMLDPSWGGKDAPWWYNEAASVSLLAGALWRSGAWAMEEYVFSHTTGGKTRNGRADLFFETRRPRRRAVVEAKQIWLGWSRNTALELPLKRVRRRAAKQVHRAPSAWERYERWVALFIVPHFAARVASAEGGSLLDEKLHTLVRCVEKFAAKHRGIAAWAFPADRRGLPSKRVPHHIYPGIALVMVPTPKPNRRRKRVR